MDIKKAKIKLGHQCIRFCRSFETVYEIRTGSCTPDKCETLQGEKGNACCHLDGACSFVTPGGCQIYDFRPPNCRIFPRSSEDLKLVKNCGYKFTKK